MMIRPSTSVLSCHGRLVALLLLASMTDVARTYCPTTRIVRPNPARRTKATLLSQTSTTSTCTTPFFRNHGYDKIGRSLATSTRNWAAARNKDDSTEDAVIVPVDELVNETSRVLRSVSWFSWWSQVILTTVSSVILVFARNVIGRQQQSMSTTPNLFLSSTGLIVSAVSILWTWGNGARLSRRMVRKPTSKYQAANLLRRAIRVGGTLNMVGLLLNLIAAEEIVGALAIKVLTNRGSNNAMLLAANAVEGLQPLDILIVQANTNSLLSHFCSLASHLYLTNRVDILDPPSKD